MKALVGTSNQEKALVGAFSVIVQLHGLIDLRHYHVTALLISHWWVVDQVAELRKAFDSFDSEKRGAIR